MLDLHALDIDERAMALEDQTDYEHRWLMDSRTGDLIVWTSDTGSSPMTTSFAGPLSCVA